MSRFSYLALVGLIIGGCVSTPRNTNQNSKRAPSSTNPVFSKTLKPLIDKWIKKDPVKMSEILLDIPEEHRKNFTLAEDSKSLQKTSSLFPRAILFGNTGETIFTFNGDPKLGGYSTLEIADFDSLQKTVNFYEVRFKKEPEVGSKDDYITLSKDEIFVDTDNIEISRANPTKCMHCHSSHYSSPDQEIRFATYIWSEYNRWPGLYGENDDALALSKNPEKPTQLDNLKKIKAAVKDPKRNEYARYRTLMFGPNEADPYYLVPKDYLAKMPNTRLTFFIAIQYSRMIANFVLKEPLMQNNATQIINDWLCEEGRPPFSYPITLRPSQSAVQGWHVGISTMWRPGDRQLKDHILSHIIYGLKGKKPNWKFPKLLFELQSDFYKTTSETTEFLRDKGLLQIYKYKEDLDPKYMLCESLKRELKTK